MTHDIPNKTVLGFDYGSRRIGVAVGQTITQTATPLTTIDCKQQSHWDVIEKLIAQWQPNVLIVGLPVSEQPSASYKAAKKFAQELQAKFTLPVELHDEQYTSSAATAFLQEKQQKNSVKRKIQKQDIDQVAAALIVQSWLRNTG